MRPRRSFAPLFWTLTQLGSRVRAHPPGGVEEEALDVPALRTISVPTRHGDLRVLVQYPGASVTPPADPSDRTGPRRAAPVIVHLHGGGFVNRHPEQDRHIARHLAARLGAVVLLPDYSTAPAARYPQAEEETYDLVRWVRTAGRRHGWDGGRLVVSGVSAGAKLTVNACQQLRAAAEPAPVAVMLVVPVVDLVRTDRTSSVRRPAISPFVQRFVGWAYLPDAARRSEPLASPRFDRALGAAVPTALVLTAAHDTLAAEGAALVDTLRAAGVDVTHHEYAGTDHGFIAQKPVSTIRDALGRMVDFLRPLLDTEGRPVVDQVRSA